MKRRVRHMESVFLVCFLVGLGLTAVSFLLGATHGAHSLDGGHGGHGADLHGGHAGHTGNAANGAHGDGSHGNGDGAHTGVRLGFLNTMAITAFLTWFGGIGYILTRFPAVAAPLTVLGAAAGGVIGAAGINYFLHHILARGETTMEDADDHTLPGTAARVTSAIYPGGVGEITFPFAGTTRIASARSTSGLAIPRDTEVVVLKVRDGVVYVETWERALEEPGVVQDMPPPALPPSSSAQL